MDETMHFISFNFNSFCAIFANMLSNWTDTYFNIDFKTLQ